MKDLTTRQQQFVYFLKKYLADKGYPPTIRETAQHFAMTTKGAYDHLKALEKKGVIKCSSKLARGIELQGQGSNQDLKAIPLLTIDLLSPYFGGAFHQAGSINVVYQGPHKKLFALTVNDDSLKALAIIDNDIAIFAQTNQATNNDLVLVQIEESYSIKHFFNEGNRLKLQSASGSPLYTTNAKIMGVLLQVIRSYPSPLAL